MINLVLMDGRRKRDEEPYSFGYREDIVGYRVNKFTFIMQCAVVVMQKVTILYYAVH